MHPTLLKLKLKLFLALDPSLRFFTKEEEVTSGGGLPPTPGRSVSHALRHMGWVRVGPPWRWVRAGSALDPTEPGPEAPAEALAPGDPTRQNLLPEGGDGRGGTGGETMAGDPGAAPVAPVPLRGPGLAALEEALKPAALAESGLGAVDLDRLERVLARGRASVVEARAELLNGQGWAALPFCVLRMILERVKAGPSTSTSWLVTAQTTLACGATNKAWRRALDEDLRMLRCLRPVDLFDYDSKSIREDPIWYAARQGNLELVLWLRAIGCQLDETVCENACQIATRFGHLDVLRWAHENGAPLSDEVHVRAVMGGHLNVLQWLQDQSVFGCPFDEECIG